MTQTPADRPPLDGLRVVEVGGGRPIAFCARQFALWGADVLRLEPRETANDGGSTVAAERLFLHANKRLQRLDGQRPDRELIAATDVLLTDWPAAQLRDGDLDVHRLAEEHPRLVVVAYSGFGDGGPYAEYASTELILQALAGYMAFNGAPDREPLRAPGHVVDYAQGANAFVGALAALRAREVTGRGSLVQVAGLEAVASLTQYTRTQYFRRPIRRQGNLGPPMLPCADGYLYFNYLLGWSIEYLTFALEIDLDLIPEDAGARYAFLSEHTRGWRAQELFERMGQFGATCAIAKSVEEVLHDQHLEARGFFRTLDRRDDEGRGHRLRFPGAAVHSTTTPSSEPGPPQPFTGWRDGRAVRLGDSHDTTEPPRPLGRPLDGLGVLDLTQAWLGPYAAMLLADLGADVIKVESPARPDVWRGVSELPPVARDGSHRYNTCHFFNSVNRNKRSLTLDLNQPQGKELFLELVRRADVLLENYTPRVMGNFGLGYDVLRQANPRLVMVSFSGYGKTGPYQAYRAHGASVETIAGWPSIFGYAEAEPITMGEYPVDPVTGLHMAASAIMGLLARGVSGEGQAMDGSMMESAAGYIGDELLLAQLAPEEVGRRGNRDRGMAPHGVFPCAGEDRWIAIAVRDDRDWTRLLTAVDDPTLASPRYATSVGRLRHVDELEAALTRWTVAREPRAVMERLQAAGVPAGVVQGPDEALADPHLVARGWFQYQDHADVGRHAYHGFPWSFSGATLSADHPPPRLGEHSRELLRSELNLTETRIDALFAAGVTGAVLDASDAGHEAASRRRTRQIAIPPDRSGPSRASGS